MWEEDEGKKPLTKKRIIELGGHYNDSKHFLWWYSDTMDGKRPSPIHINTYRGTTVCGIDFSKKKNFRYGSDGPVYDKKGDIIKDKFCLRCLFLSNFPQHRDYHPTRERILQPSDITNCPWWRHRWQHAYELKIK